MFPYKKTGLFQKSGFKSKLPKKPENTPLSGTYLSFLDIKTTVSTWHETSTWMSGFRTHFRPFAGTALSRKSTFLHLLSSAQSIYDQGLDPVCRSLGRLSWSVSDWVVSSWTGFVMTPMSGFLPSQILGSHSATGSATPIVKRFKLYMTSNPDTRAVSIKTLYWIRILSVWEWREKSLVNAVSAVLPALWHRQTA